MKIILMASRNAGYETLQYLVNTKHQILAVVTTKDPENSWYKSVEQLALRHKLLTLTPIKTKDQEFIKKIVQMKADVIFSMYYDKIIPKEILNSARYNINFHGGILPRYRGCVSSAWAIINNEPETAITAHFMKAGIDTGDIIDQKKIVINMEDTGRDVYEKVSHKAVELFQEVLENLENNNLSSYPQRGQETYYGRSLPYNGIINWNWSATKVYNFIRATNFPPFKPAKTFYGSNVIYIDKCFILNKSHIENTDYSNNVRNGTVIKISNLGIIIKVKDKDILLKSLHVRDKLYDAREFTKIFKLKIGDVFGGYEKMEVKIGNKMIGDGHPVFIVAEAGVNHEGNIEIAKKLVDYAVSCGADAVKFQSFKAEKLNTRNAPKAQYHIETTGTEGSWFDLLKKEELTTEMHHILADYCKQKNIMFLSTPYDEDSADLLDSLGVPAFKIASTDLTNIPLLEHIAKKGKPIIIPSAMGSYHEIEEAINCVRKHGNEKIIVCQCTGNYPARISDANLLVMPEIRRRYKVLVGYSDHMPTDVLPIAATVLGSCYHEKHFTLDKNMQGPDHRTSIDPIEFKQMVNHIRLAEKCLGDPNNKPTKSEKDNIPRLRKSVVANKKIIKGSVITQDMVTAKRPATGLHPRHVKDFIGKKLNIDINEDELLDFKMIDHG
jgi:N,N'-diacetyllegionaminate synthase